MADAFRFCPRCATARTTDMPFCAKCAYAFPVADGDLASATAHSGALPEGAAGAETEPLRPSTGGAARPADDFGADGLAIEWDEPADPASEEPSPAALPPTERESVVIETPQGPLELVVDGGTDAGGILDGVVPSDVEDWRETREPVPDDRRLERRIPKEPSAGAADAKGGSPGCSCLLLIVIAIVIFLGGRWLVEVVSGPPADVAPAAWADVACASLRDVVSTQPHFESITSAMTAGDDARILSEIEALDAAVSGVPERIGALEVTWAKGDLWLTGLDAAATDVLIFARTVKEAAMSGDTSKIDQAFSALSAATDQLATVKAGYPALGLKCPGIP